LGRPGGGRGDDPPAPRRRVDERGCGRGRDPRRGAAPAGAHGGGLSPAPEPARVWEPARTSRFLRMPRIGALILAAPGAGLGLLLAGSAVAATPPEEGQIVLFTPEKVWDETSWLSFIVRPGTKEPVLHARGRPFRVSWNMTSITGKTTTDALASVAEG